MKVALESPPVLTDSDLEVIVVIWNRKSFVNTVYYEKALCLVGTFVWLEHSVLWPNLIFQYNFLGRRAPPLK